MKRYNLIKSSLICLFWSLGSVSSYGQDLSFLNDSGDYLWPTEASTYISSTFGETRAAHFHAGLDIRTWGREGYRVFATKDGYVQRLSISPYGYGKMITLRHDDGSYSLYAHLNRFEDNLMTVADSIRFNRGNRFLLNEVVEGKEIRVRQGDLIGYTGSTGAGPPHLHFELRTPDNEPFNPLLTNLQVDDTIPPVFNDLGIEHLNPDTYHTDRLETRTAQRRGGSTRFGTVETDGPIGLSVNVHDRADRTPNIYAVYQLKLIHDSDTLFASRVDTYSYQNAREMFVDRVFPLLRERRQGFQRLFTVNGNQLPFYETGPSRGVVDLPEGEHFLRIVALDYFGNRSEAHVDVIVRDRTSPVAERIESIPTYPRNGEPNGKPARPLRTSPISPHLLTEHRAERAPAGPVEPEPIPTATRQLFFERNESAQTGSKVLIPGERQFLHIPDQSVWVEFPEDALFDTLHAELTVTYRDSLPVVRLTPDHLPLKRPVTVHILLPDLERSGETIGLFAYDSRRNRHNFLSRGTAGQVVRASIGEFQELHLLVDQTPPVVGAPRIHNNLAGIPVVSVPARDSRSGINYVQSRILVNGREAITEYDPDRNRLIYYDPQFQPKSQNRVEAIVYDRMGNRTQRTFEQIPGN